MDTTEKIQHLLSKHGYKVTTVRKKVYLTLANTPHPMSNSELIAEIQDIDKVSVYRTLTLYETIGVIHRIWNGFKSKVELSEEFSPHHHHFTCRRCNKVISFKSNDIEKALDTLQASIDVSIEHHLLELSGTCKDCREKKRIK